MTTCMYIAQSGDAAALKKLLSLINNPQELLQASDKFKRTALMYASHHSAAVAAILNTLTPAQQLDQLKATDNNCETPLMYSAKSYDPDSISEMLKVCNDAQKIEQLLMKDNLGLNILMYAAKGNAQSFERMLSLIPAGIDKAKLLMSVDNRKTTALMWAAYEGTSESIRIILNTPGIDSLKLLQATDKFEATALIKAAIAIKVSNLKTLLEAYPNDAARLAALKNNGAKTILSYIVNSIPMFNLVNNEDAIDAVLESISDQKGKLELLNGIVIEKDVIVTGRYERIDQIMEHVKKLKQALLIKYR